MAVEISPAGQQDHQHSTDQSDAAVLSISDRKENGLQQHELDPKNSSGGSKNLTNCTESSKNNSDDFVLLADIVAVQNDVDQIDDHSELRHFSNKKKTSSTGSRQDDKMDNLDNANLSEESPCKSSSIDGPYLRRSQRASAKRAHDLIKGDIKQDNMTTMMMVGGVRRDDGVQSKVQKLSSAENGDDEFVVIGGGEKPPRKPVDPSAVDASDPHFAVQMTDSGAVVLMSDESDVSSLHTKEIDFLKKNFEKLKCKELTEEQLVERERMIQELKTQLCIEESRLSFLKRVRQTQKLAHKDSSNHGPQTAAAVASRNNALANSSLPRPPAYRPPVANLPNAQTQNHRHQQQPVVNAKLVGPVAQGTRVSGMTGAQTSVNASALNLQKVNVVQPAGATPLHHSASVPKVSQAASVDSVQQPPRSHIMDSQTPAQREAAAKLAWRRQMEKTLLQIPPPKPPPAELHFVPNPNQPDFLYLVGLDEIVERLLSAKEAHLLQKQQKLAAAADKAVSSADGKLNTSGQSNSPAKSSDESNNSATTTTLQTINNNDTNSNNNNSSNTNNPAAKRPVRRRIVEGVENLPFSCAQCSTDYTPTWKKVSDKEEKIMCEQCVRSNQKKALRIAHTNLLREKFGEALKQEREIERQIKEGTFNFASLASESPSVPNVRSTAPSVATPPNLTSRGSSHVLSTSGINNTAAKQPVSQHRYGGVQNHVTSSSLHKSITGASGTQSMQSTNAAAAAALAAAAASTHSAFGGAAAAMNFAAAANAALPMVAAAQMLGVGWNPLLATARFPAAAANAMALRQNWQAAVAAAAAAAASTHASSATTNSISNATPAAAKEILRNMQQMQQQQQQQNQALQRQIYLDMMPRTQKWK